MWQKIVNFVLARNFRLRRTSKKLREKLGAEATEEVLKLLFRGMALFFILDSNFRRNLKNFNAQYLFTIEHGPINVALLYKNNQMKVVEKNLPNPNVRVDFSDYKAIIDFLTHPDPDILDQMLNQKLNFKGNLNYIYKLGYMSRHLLVNLGIAR